MPGADANAPDEDHWLALMTGKVDLPDGLTEEEKRALAWPADWGFFEQPPATVKIRNHRGEFVRHEINLDAENLRWLPSLGICRARDSSSRDASPRAEAAL